MKNTLFLLLCGISFISSVFAEGYYEKNLYIEHVYGKVSLTLTHIASIYNDMFFNISTSEVISLDLINNKITKLQPNTFAIFTNLKFLNMVENNLTELVANTFTGLHEVETLKISESQLVHIDKSAFVDLKNLKKLLLEFTKIRTFNPAWLSGMNLTHLGFPRNQIHGDFPAGIFKEQKYLKTIDFSWNCIKNISRNTFDGLENLISLDLHQNKIGIIEAGAFRNFNISTLTLRNNNLTVIEVGTFKNVHIDCLDLSQNQISTFANGALYNSTVHLLNVRDNKQSLEETDFSTIININQTNVIKTASRGGLSILDMCN